MKPIRAFLCHTRGLTATCSKQERCRSHALDMTVKMNTLVTTLVKEKQSRRSALVAQDIEKSIVLRATAPDRQQLLVSADVGRDHNRRLWHACHKKTVNGLE